MIVVFLTDTVGVYIVGFKAYSWIQFVANKAATSTSDCPRGIAYLHRSTDIVKHRVVPVPISLHSPLESTARKHTEKVSLRNRDQPSDYFLSHEHVIESTETSLWSRRHVSCSRPQICTGRRLVKTQLTLPICAFQLILKHRDSCSEIRKKNFVVCCEYVVYSTCEFWLCSP